MVSESSSLPIESKHILNIPKTHTNSIIFIFLSSLPLLGSMILYETFLENNLIELIKISIPRSQQDFFTVYYWITPTSLIDNLTWELSRNLILLSLTYIPLSILRLISMIAVINLASRIYKEDKSIELKELDYRHTNWERSKGLLTTFIYTLFLSTSGFLVTICLLQVLFYAKFDTFFTIFVSRIVYPLVLICLLLKYLELSVVWNLSLVVSVLEEEYGVSAFALSFYVCEGKKKCGVYLMLVFVFVEIVMRIPCIYVDDGWVGLVLRTSLLWVAGFVKCVGFVVYYHECKNKVFGSRKIETTKENEEVISNVA